MNTFFYRAPPVPASARFPLNSYSERFHKANANVLAIESLFRKDAHQACNFTEKFTLSQVLFCKFCNFPVHTERKFNVQKTFNLRPVSTRGQTLSTHPTFTCKKLPVEISVVKIYQ